MNSSQRYLQSESQPADKVTLSAAGATALACQNILVFIGIFSIAPTLPAIKAHFAGVPNADLLTQLVGAMSGFTFAFASLVVGRLINRVGYRGVYVISLLIFAGGGAAAAVASNLYILILTRAFVGLASAGIVNASLVAVGRILPPPAQTRMLGLQSLIGGTFGIVAYPVIGQLTAIDWRLAFAVHLLALPFVGLVMTLPAVGHSEEGKTSVVRAHAVGGLILAAAIFVGIVIFIATMFGPLFLATLGVTNAGLLSIPPMAASIGSVVGAMLYVFLRPRIGLAATFTLTIAAMGVGLCTAGLSAGVWEVATGTLIASIGAGAFCPNLNSAAITASPENPGPALGLVNALLYGAMILFPLISGALAAAAGGPRAVLLGFAAFAGMLAALFLFGGRFRQIPNELPRLRSTI